MAAVILVDSLALRSIRGVVHQNRTSPSSDAEDPFLDGSVSHRVVLDRYERPGNERESLTAKIQP